MKGYMYILECSDGSYYTGSTTDLELRLAQHQNGEGANHTRKRLPVRLVYYEEFQRIDEAFYREKQVQGWSRKKKEALIKGEYEKLPELSRSKKVMVPELVEGTVLEASKSNSVASINSATMTYSFLSNLFHDKILHYKYPKPYPNGKFNPKAIKAIVLGCDPSNFSNNGETSQLETVFGIEGVGKDGRYFAGILKNLNEVGLTLTDIYVQNLCRNYFYKETKKNDIWYDAAAHWRKTLKDELIQLGIQPNVPVFLTAEELYRALVNEKHTARQCKEFYQIPELIPIEPSENHLERPLIPLFRGGAGYYNLKNWENYRNRIVELLANSKN